ncbi:MAG: Uma2 family endonuclease [bacterium]
MSVKASTAKKAATYADIEALPDHVVGELIAGELIVSPRPTPRHAHSASSLSMKLGPPFHFGDGGPGGWWILFEPELHLGGDVVVPDLAGWRRERLPTLPTSAWFELSPDWVCEVISPSTARVDRAAKLPVYARERVGHVWLVDPDARTVEILRRQEQTYLMVAVHSGNETVRAEPFDAIDLDLSAIWGETG